MGSYGKRRLKRRIRRRRKQRGGFLSPQKIARIAAAGALESAAKKTRSGSAPKAILKAAGRGAFNSGVSAVKRQTVNKALKTVSPILKPFKKITSIF